MWKDFFFPSLCATLNFPHIRTSSKMFYFPSSPPSSSSSTACFHSHRRRTFSFPSPPLRSICRIHLFKSFKSQLLSVHTMAHCPPAQESHCPLRHSDKGTWMSTPTARQRRWRRRRIIMSGHGRLVKGERSEVRDGAAIKGVSSVNSFVFCRKSPSISHRDVLSSGHVNHTVRGN